MSETLDSKDRGTQAEVERRKFWLEGDDMIVDMSTPMVEHIHDLYRVRPGHEYRLLRLAQFGCGHQFHGFSDLLGIFDALNTPFNIS